MSNDARLRALTERIKTIEARTKALEEDYPDLDARIRRIEVVLAQVIKELVDDREDSVEALVGADGEALLRMTDCRSSNPETAPEMPGNTRKEEGDGDSAEDEYTRYL